MKYLITITLLCLACFSAGMATNKTLGNSCQDIVINETLVERESVNGIYYHNHYFVVVTKDRDPLEVMRTTIHEATHYMMMSDEKHFGGLKE